VVAALAGELVPARTPAASRAPASSRRAARRQSLLRPAFIVSPFKSTRPPIARPLRLTFVSFRSGRRRALHGGGAFDQAPVAFQK
jgi:hypothetical protein